MARNNRPHGWLLGTQRHKQLPPRVGGSSEHNAAVRAKTPGWAERRHSSAPMRRSTASCHAGSRRQARTPPRQPTARSTGVRHCAMPDPGTAAEAHRACLDAAARQRPFRSPGAAIACRQAQARAASKQAYLSRARSPVLRAPTTCRSSSTVA